MTTTENHNEYRCLTPQEIGKAVTMFRHMAGMKQLTLALEAGVTERTVQRIEKGEKVNDESLRAIARAFRMEDTSFIGPRNVLSSEEAWKKTMKELEKRTLIDAHRFAGLKDAEAVLESGGAIIDDQRVKDAAAKELALFKDNLADWSVIYGDLFSHGEKLDAWKSLLQSAQELEAMGYVIRYGVYKTEDLGLRLATILIVPKSDDALCAVKQLLVPTQFEEMSRVAVQKQ
jgi:transcriptional regulator with XRE-family HTH domain